jgi:hypothetical protein
MEIKQGMKFNLKADLQYKGLPEEYFIHSVSGNNIHISWENDILGGTPYTKEEVKRYFEEGSWIELKTETDAGN